MNRATFPDALIHGRSSFISALSIFSDPRIRIRISHSGQYSRESILRRSGTLSLRIKTSVFSSQSVKPSALIPGNVHEELYLQSQKELEKLRNENDCLRTENSVLRSNFDSVAKKNLELEDKLEKSEVKF